MEVNREAQERGEIEGEMMTSEPKPCPFCPPILSDPAFVPFDMGAFGTWWKVGCETCGCSSGTPEATREAALEVWNTRPERTCKMVPSECVEGYALSDQEEAYRCSKCGTTVYATDSSEVKFCIECGAKVAI